MSRSSGVAGRHRSHRECGTVACVAALAVWLPLELSAVGPQRIVEGAAHQDSEQPVGEGFLGLTLRDIPDGSTVVSWTFPGPLDGAGLQSNRFDLQRPDLIVSIDGKPLNAAEFSEYIRSRSPGDEVTIRYRRSRERGSTIPSASNHEEEILEITVTLDERSAWRGTIGRAPRISKEVVFDGPALLDPVDPKNILGSAIAENDLGAPLENLLQTFRAFQERSPDYNSLSRVRAGFAHPFRLAELEQMITDPTHGIADDPLGTARALVVDNLDLPWPPIIDGNAMHEADRTFGTLPPSVSKAMESVCRDQVRISEAFQQIEDRPGFARQCLEFLRVPKRTFYIAGPRTRDHIAVINTSTRISLDPVLLSIADARASTDIGEDVLAAQETIETPPELKNAVEGAIIAAHHYREVGWVVVGSTERNRYDLAKIAVVVDPGGDDEYYATDLRLGMRVTIDLAGNDVYTGTPEQGPASALLGISYTIDYAGDDRYEGGLLSCGAAMYGVAVLVDRAGNDTYIGSEWSLGAACYGAGMIIDLGGGGDTYLGEFLCEGVGGPRGLGCIIDQAGRDLYRANGPTPSAYGTPAVYQSFSQGVGFGYRNYAAGGIGLLSDLAGDDRYEAGEFAQGGAYYFSLGVLHDAGGRDLYYGNRYGQGFGVHQAHGILADDAGDDTYWSMTAASQGAAWDVGAGLLIDRGGNDTYQADGLAQGGASMQGIAMLVDLDGVDRYSAGGGATQGQSGGDSYHYHDTGAFSFSVLLDLGGDQDHYSRGRTNNAVESTGALNESKPENSSLHGVVIDR